MTVIEELQQIRTMTRDIEAKLFTADASVSEEMLRKRLNAKALIEAIRNDAYRAEIMLMGIE